MLTESDATGSGKSYMICAFGMVACKYYYNTKYVRLSDLLIVLKTARDNGTYRKVMSKYATPSSLSSMNGSSWNPHKRNSRISSNCSITGGRGLPLSSAHSTARMAGTNSLERMHPLADAILNRIIHDGYVIDIVPVDPSKDLSWERYMVYQELTICNCKSTIN